MPGHYGGTEIRIMLDKGKEQFPEFGDRIDKIGQKIGEVAGQFEGISPDEMVDRAVEMINANFSSEQRRMLVEKLLDPSASGEPTEETPSVIASNPLES